MRGDEFFRQIATTPPFSGMHPKIAAFFKDYLSREKVIQFGEKYVMNTHFPPYPSRAFETLAAQFDRVGDAEERSLFSVTLAVTNRCMYRCWHCYNAGRTQKDVPLEALIALAAELQDMGAVTVTLSGGEPLLRGDLEQIAGAFDSRSCLKLNTTGMGLTAERASALSEHGLFALGVSLDSPDPREHDRLRGHEGAFKTALAALHLAADAGLYPYVIAVATREFLEPERFHTYLRLAADEGAREIHLLEPSAVGNLAGESGVLLDSAERDAILHYQEDIARDDSLPIVSSFAHLESPEAFGCGAGLTHLYIDGAGEVCPCNLVPLSFGNILTEPLGAILDRMAVHFRKPRPSCVGHILGGHVPSGPLPLSPEDSARLCDNHLPHEHPVPRFFAVRSEAAADVGSEDVRDAYDRIHGSYDEFWVTEAGKPVRDMVAMLSLAGSERVFEAGCGTGFATALLAEKLREGGGIVAVDISAQMIEEARKRLGDVASRSVRFVHGDALELLGSEGPFELVFSSWVLGYIPLEPFFRRAGGSLKRGGSLAFIVHKEHSPREPLDIFGELVAEDPSVLAKRVRFDFPRDTGHIAGLLSGAGLEPGYLRDGAITFRYPTPADVLEHLLKSGAGTAYYEALDPVRRPGLEKRFFEILAARKRSAGPYEVVHDYIACIARKT